MIKSLHVRNYALIDRLDLNFESGFSSITGETGAGKSILLGAMGLALGDRADLKSALNPDEKCVVELTVNIRGYGLESLFDENDVDYSEETILRREILPSGKSRAFVNDSPARVSALNAIAVRLIDIHSQNDTILLRDESFQLGLIDGLAKNDKAKISFTNAFTRWRNAEKNLRELLDDSTAGLDMDYQRFLLDELLEARLESKDEEDVLEEELKRLQHAEDVAEGIGEADRALSEGGGVVDMLNSAIQSLSTAAKYDSQVQDLLERCKSARIELQDIASELSSAIETFDADPQRLSTLDQRMSLLQHLKAKHRSASVEELMQIRDDIAVSIDRFEKLGDNIEAAKSEVESAHSEMMSQATVLTQSRLQILPTIQQELGQLLTKLNMPDAVLQLEMSALEKPTSAGLDAVHWMFSANAGRTAQPLDKVASGGELSRVMLALKAIMSQSKGLPTIVFDEIDTGISGETARRVAEILKSMGGHMQVIAITHLPQIAAAGKTHYLVEKQVVDGVTRTKIRSLTPNERVEEVSRILSGDTASEAARANAKELLSEE